MKAWITVREAADVCGVTPSRIRQLVIEGRIRRKTEHNVQLVSAADVQKYANGDRTPGPKTAS